MSVAADFLLPAGHPLGTGARLGGRGRHPGRAPSQSGSAERKYAYQVLLIEEFGRRIHGTTLQVEL